MDALCNLLDVLEHEGVPDPALCAKARRGQAAGSSGLRRGAALSARTAGAATVQGCEGAHAGAGRIRHDHELHGG